MNTLPTENLNRIQSTTYHHLLVIGDTHVANHRQCGGASIDGLNQRCRWIINSLKQHIRDAYYSGNHPGRVLVLQLGDFFDVAKPPPAIILAALSLIKETRDSADWIVLSGNHDSNGPEQASAVRLLEYAGAHTVEKPQLVSVRTSYAERPITNIACIPYTHPSAMQAFVDAQELIAKSDVVLAHYGIVEDAAQPRPDVLKLSEILELDRKFSNNRNVYRRQYYSGHEHNSSAFYAKDPGPTVHSVGAFVDTNFDINNPPMRGQYDAYGRGSVYIRSQTSAKPTLYVYNNNKTIDDIFIHPEAFLGGLCIRFPMGSEPFAEMLKACGLIANYAIAPAQPMKAGTQDTEEGDDKENTAFLSSNGLLAEATKQLEKISGRSYQEGLAFAMGMSK